MNASLHRVNLKSVKVMNLESSTVVTVADENGNDVSIFLNDLNEVLVLASRIMGEMDKVTAKK